MKTSELHASDRVRRRLIRINRRLGKLRVDGPPQVLLVPGRRLRRDQIIVFPGSFNPPTNAHMAMLHQARRYARTHGSMQLFAAFSKQTIDKETIERPLLLDRIVWLQMALRHHVPRTGILLFNRGLYVEQAQAIHSAFPEVRRLLFLIGFDKIVQILDPRYYDDREVALKMLFSLAELLVAPRGNAGEAELRELLSRPENQPYARSIHILPLATAYREISSTRVREGNGLHMQEVPPEVRSFLRATRAYAPPLRGANGQEFDYYGERSKLLMNWLRSAPSGR